MKGKLIKKTEAQRIVGHYLSGRTMRWIATVLLVHEDTVRTVVRGRHRWNKEPLTRGERRIACACGCPKTFVRHERNGGQRFATGECRLRRRSNQPSRAGRRARKPTHTAARFPKAKYVYAALDESEPGMCPWGCERPLPPSRKYSCGDRECEREYQRAYRRGRLEVERPQPVVRACKCGREGCSFATRFPGQLFSTQDCWKAWRKANPRPKPRMAAASRRKGGWSDMASFFAPRRPAVLRPFRA